MQDDVLRTAKVLETYREYRKQLGEGIATVDLASMPPVKKWSKWVIIENKFPYDQITVRHDLLVAIRRFSHDYEMTQEERDELFAIKKELAETKEYDSLMENLTHKRTVPLQYHLHCLKFRDVTPVKDLS